MSRLARPGASGRLASLWSLAALGLAPISAGCGDAADAHAQAEISFRVSGLRGPLQQLPEEITQLRTLLIPESGGQRLEQVANVSALADADGDGHKESVVRNAPTDIPFRLRVEGMNQEGVITHVLQTSRITLAPGEKRIVDATLYPTGEAIALEGPRVPSPRFFHTMTTLPDGKVLIAGGLTRFVEVKDGSCLERFGSIVSRCFEASATNEAWLFDPTSGTFDQLEPMTEPRAGHSATLMTSGRLLVAGGTRQLLVGIFRGAIADGSNAAVPFGLAESLSTVVRHGEVFAPPALGDGYDAAEGQFFAQPAEVIGRALHSAVVLPWADDHVGLFGSAALNAFLMKGTEYEPAISWDLLSEGLDGTFEVEAHFGPLGGIPSQAARVGDAVWLLGAHDARSNAGLGLRFIEEAGTIEGRLESASTATAFPARNIADTAEHPELGLPSSTVSVLQDRYIVLGGWFGPRCSGSDPIFPRMGATPYCAGPSGGFFTVDTETGYTLPTAAPAARSFGTGVTLADGRAIVIGGSTGFDWQFPTALIGFEATTRDGMAQAFEPGVELGTGRLIPKAVRVGDDGVFVFGGAQLDATVDNLFAIAEPEMMFFVGSASN